jgi:hypothetical protein
MYDPTIGRFVSFDAFEADPGEPTHLHKYNYAASDAINHVDPSGQDFNYVSLMVASGIGAALGAISTAGVNYSLGRPLTTNLGWGALFGGIAGPLAVAFPVFGAGLAGYGVYSGWNLNWQVWTNPRSTNGQLAASLVIFGASLFGGYAAGRNLQANGWYNPAFEKPPTVAAPGLTRNSPLSETFEGVPDNAMVHISPASLSELAEGVRPGIDGKSYWFRWGDVKHLTPDRYRTAVGPIAKGGRSDAGTFVFKLPGDGTTPTFRLGTKAGGYFQEYVSTERVVPDAGGIVSPTGG